MNRKSVIESSDQERIEIDYSSLPPREIGRRIRAYEKKYGMPFGRYNRQFNCSDASPLEMTDVMDWEYLVLEKKTRGRVRTNKKKTFAYEP
jgi:hypothetical protein